MQRSIITALLLACAVLSSSALFAQSDRYSIQNSAYYSTFLDGAIASTYKINRAPNSAVINISVQDTQNKNSSVTAEVSGTVTNILHQVKTLKFRPIKDGTAIYYISEIRFDNQDVLTFKIDVKPEGEKRSERVKWQQKFWRQ